MEKTERERERETKKATRGYEIQDEARERESKRVSMYFVVDRGPRDRLCPRSGTPRSMLSVQGQRTGRAETRSRYSDTPRVHSIQQHAGALCERENERGKR